MSFATTGGTIIADAFGNIGMYTPTPNETSDARRWLNQIVTQWQLLPLTSVYTKREVFPLVAGQGTPDNPYTIGNGGDFNTSRPTAFTGVGILVSSTPQPFELVRNLYTDAAYQAIIVKTLGSEYFDGMYYRPTYEDGFGRIFLYPVPTATNDIVLYSDSQTSDFETLSGIYDLPPGCELAVTWTLSRRLCVPFGREWSQAMEIQRRDAMSIFQRANTRMADLAVDAALTAGNHGLYNILSDGTTGKV